MINKHRLLRVYISVYTLILVSIETLETAFNLISKHLEFRQNFSATCRTFNSLLHCL